MQIEKLAPPLTTAFLPFANAIVLQLLCATGMELEPEVD
jgi:hypothetical protein